VQKGWARGYTVPLDSGPFCEIREGRPLDTPGLRKAVDRTRGAAMSSGQYGVVGGGGGPVPLGVA